MTEEPVTLKTAEGATGVAAAQVERYTPGARRGKAALFIVGGILGGAACIIIPVLHLITTWGLPVLGIVLGLRALRTEFRVYSVSGRCPACDEVVEIVGLSPDHPRPCPRCRTELSVRVESGPPFDHRSG